MHRTGPVSVVSARVKLAFTSSVVQPAGLERRCERASHRRVEKSQDQSGMDGPDRVVVECLGLGLKDGAPALCLDQAIPEGLRDGGLREVARDHPLEVLER